MGIEKQDSNFVGLNVARAQADGTLGATPIFRQREPNSFADLGGDYKTVARRPFNPSRQKSKGTIVDLDADGGFNEDVTVSNMVPTMEDALYANAHPKANVVNVQASAANGYIVADNAGFAVGALVQGKGFGLATNNGLHKVTGIPAGKLTVTPALTDEAAAATKTVRVVGYELAAGDVALTVVGGLARLTSTAFDFTTLNVVPGEFMIVGGDAAGTSFDNTAPFYARVAAISAHVLDFDKTAGAPIIADVGAAKTLRLFVGTMVRNEPNPANIVRHELYVERLLGRDADGVQSEVLERAILNELNWNSPLADKVTVDLKYLSLSHRTRTGAQGPLSTQAGATLLPAYGEDAINTSSNLYRARLSIIDPATLNPTSLFARVTEWNIELKNNGSVDKAQGTLGGFDTTAGVFELGGKFKAYFGTVAAVQAIRNNADVTFDAIYTKNNAAIAMDVPLIGLSGGRLSVEMDKPIMLPLNIDGAQHSYGHTFLLTFFPYAPTAVMATG